MLERLSEDWTEERGGQLRVEPGRRKQLPLPVRLSGLGELSPSGLFACVAASATWGGAAHQAFYPL